MASRALDKLKKGKASALARLRRIKDNSEAIANRGMGVGAGFLGAKYYGKWLAKRVKEGKATSVPKIGQSYGRVGAGVLIAYGMFGEDERATTIALVSGATLLGADEGISSYVAEIAAAPAGGGAGA